MSDITINSLKIGQAAKELEERKLKERKRNLLLLVKHFLNEEGLAETVRCFENEAKVPENYTICDNIDLGSILHEYETYYHFKFNKQPKICRKENGTGNVENISKAIRNISKCMQKTSTGMEPVEKKRSNIIKRAEETPKNSSNISNNKETGAGDGNSLIIHSPLSITSYGSVSPRDQQDDDLQKIKLLKPLSTFEGYCEEWKLYANMIAKEIIQGNLSVKWDEVVGLEDAKSLLKEAIVYPIKYPDLFSGILEPWRGLLLYGPPGTGKTLLAKAVATECNTTFFNISASSIVSKWRGDSEKLVRVMFEMARHQAPSTVFLDELDALASRRGNSSEHEASRRLKAELLTQLDGLKGTNGVFLLAASNIPWELDPAILRRLEKKILVDLPTLDARKKIFIHYLPKNILQQPKLEANLDYNNLANETEGYSGSEIKLICKETVMESMRHIFETLEDKQINSTDLAFKAVNLKRIETSDVLRVIEKMKPSSTKYLTKYREWKSEYECD